MDQKILYAIMGALAIIVVVLGIELQHERSRTTGINIDLGKNGLTIQKKTGD